MYENPVRITKVFWADAISTTAYLINRGPSVPLDYQLLEEVWTGNEVNLSHMKVFCCASYILLNSNSRDKLDPKSKRCYFIGYGSDMCMATSFGMTKTRKLSEVEMLL